jgi:ATP-dependent RNA helicase RhlE
MFVRKADKRRLLVNLIKDEKVRCGIVFTRTKHGANRLVKQLDQSRINAAAIHGNKSQGARTKALAGFKDGSIAILVATDIASRGIDVDGITHVFNYDLPNEPESYVHRIGRTARAGRSGIAYGFCDESESGYLVGIQQLIGREIDTDIEHEFHFSGAIPKPDQKPGKIKEKKTSNKKSQNKSKQKNRGKRSNNGDSRPRSNNPPKRQHNNKNQDKKNRSRRPKNKKSHENNRSRDER